MEQKEPIVLRIHLINMDTSRTLLVAVFERDGFSQGHCPESHSFGVALTGMLTVLENLAQTLLKITLLCALTTTEMCLHPEKKLG